MVLVLLLAFWSGRAAAEAVLEEIRFVGNEHTQPKIMLQEMEVRVGDVVDEAAIERSRQAIMDLGLFKSVGARLLDGENGKVLEISVSEKYYIFPVPKLNRDADGAISYGFQVRLDNLGGLNQQLRATYKAQRGCCETKGTVNTLSLGYRYPRIAGTHYGLSSSLDYIRTPREEVVDGVKVAQYEEQVEGLSINLQHWLGSISSGWSTGGGWFWRMRHNASVIGNAVDLLEGKGAGLSWGIAYRKVHDYLYSREGMEYGYHLTLGINEIGSDSSYSRNEFYYRHYLPVGSRPHQNLNIQFLAGLSGGRSPLEEFAYSVGGSRDLRAYEKDSLKGKSFVVMDLEYLRPLWGHNAMRGALFLDVGNAYADNRLVDFGSLESSVGFGFRYKIKSFVNLQLRFDAAYAVRTGERKYYFGTKDTF